jgi:anti-sigma regulatory factor (Ser/Thr protein kinase)/dienelactone hydrolase
MMRARRFPGKGESVTAARRFVRDVLRGQPDERIEVVELMTSELATNCVRHARTGFELAIELDAGYVRVEARDTGQGRPKLRSPAPSEPTGRGLRIVEALCDSWGVTPGASGKTVWFTVSSAEPTRSGASASEDVEGDAPAQGEDGSPAPRSARLAEAPDTVASAHARRASLLIGLMAVLLVPAGAGASAGLGSVQGPPAPATQPAGYAVGLRVLRLVDSSRTIRLRGGRRVPRTLTTIVRYPAVGAPGQSDLANAAPASGSGPYPLIVFAHGFAVTPALYARLLQSWARAGYVVAAPVFPLGSADAPGGPDESDIVNQPADMSFVISSLLSLDATAASPFAGLLDPARVAVAGHSDGGETALAVAYSRRYRDPRVRAAVILSGAMMSGVGGYSFAPGGPALLAAQGTADVLNEPKFTYAYFKRARRPKFLLRLVGAEHLPPYTRQQPELGIVERTSLVFLQEYLKGPPSEPQLIAALGSVARSSQLLGEP